MSKSGGAARTTKTTGAHASVARREPTANGKTYTLQRLRTLHAQWSAQADALHAQGEGYPSAKHDPDVARLSTVIGSYEAARASEAHFGMTSVEQALRDGADKILAAALEKHAGYYKGAQAEIRRATARKQSSAQQNTATRKPAASRSRSATRAPAKTKAAEPRAPYEMTPKQYHEAEVRHSMAEYHITRKEAEQYGVIDSDAQHFRAVHDHLRTGGTIAPKVLDALTPMQRRSVMHDFPDRFGAYLPPETRKANRASEAANRSAHKQGRETANRAAAQRAVERAASPALTHTGLVRREDRVRSNGDQRRFVSREIHSFRDAEGHEYRKAFEAPVGVHVSVPARATLADYNDLEARSKRTKAG